MAETVKGDAERAALAVSAYIERLESAAIRSSFEDGVWDVLAGVFFIWGSISRDWDVFLFFLPAALLPFVAHRIRTRLAYQRFGYAFIRRLGLRARYATLGFIGGYAGTLVWFYLDRETAQQFVPFVSMVLFGAILAFVAWNYRVWRWYAYAALAVATFGLQYIIGDWLRVSLIFGPVMLITGVVLLFRFLKRYPPRCRMEPASGESLNATKPVVSQIPSLLKDPRCYEILAILSVVDAADTKYIASRTGLDLTKLDTMLGPLKEAALVDEQDRPIGFFGMSSKADPEETDRLRLLSITDMGRLALKAIPPAL